MDEAYPGVLHHKVHPILCPILTNFVPSVVVSIKLGKQLPMILKTNVESLETEPWNHVIIGIDLFRLDSWDFSDGR